MGDVEYIRDVLMPEFLEQFIRDNAEYPGERPLGAKAEWHGIHRKVGKLKAPVWDGKEWTGRESVRRMFQEIAGHAFLAIASLDEERSPEDYPQDAEDFPDNGCTHGGDCPVHPDVHRPHNLDAHPMHATITDLLRHNMGGCSMIPVLAFDGAFPTVNPLIGMTPAGRDRLRRLRAEAAGRVMMDPARDHPGRH